MKRLCLLLLLTSCTIYNPNFDCPVDPGVPCVSLTDLEQMVIETNEEGPDLFLTTPQNPCPNTNRYVWICDHYNSEGCWVPGHYEHLNGIRRC